MSSNKQREVLFFGSLAVSIVGHEVFDDAVAAQLERQNAFVKLQTSVTAPYRRTSEAFAAVATSPLYEVRHRDAAAPPSQPGSSHQQPQQRRQQQHRQHTAFLPVLLELGRLAQASEVPPVEEMDKHLTAQRTDGVTVLNSGSATVIPSYTSATLRVQVDLSRSGCRTSPAGMQEVLLPSLNYLAREDVCTVVRVPLLTRVIEQTATAAQDLDMDAMARESAQVESSGGLDGAAGDEARSAYAAAGIALHVYVMVRVVNLAEKVRLALDADESLRTLLHDDTGAATPSPPSRGLPLRLSLTQRGEAPYGAMPLTELYRHYKRFFEVHHGAVVKHSDAVMQRLVSAPRQREAAASFPYRWSALTEMDLRPLLLGERAFAPLLLTLAHCTNLRSLHADGNKLGDVTCGRLAVLFSRHRYLAHLSLSCNGIHEAGGEQLVLLLRRNLRITSLPCAGNFFSDAMERRIAAMTQRSAAVIANDPLNVFSSHYDYLTSLSALPEATHRQALRTWAMLSASPVGDVDVMVRNTTTSSQRTIGDSPQVAMQRAKLARQARETFSLIPPAALAPLLNEVMRTVYVAVSRTVPDPLLRSLFTDIETVVVRQQAQKDRQAEADGSGSAKVSADDHGGEDALPAEVVAAMGGHYTTPIDAEKLFARSFLRIVVTAFRSVALGTLWEETAVVLEGIGRMHRDLGVMAEDYWLAVHVFMAAVRLSCGTDLYDTNHASSFLAILALAVRTTVGCDVELK